VTRTAPGGCAPWNAGSTPATALLPFYAGLRLSELIALDLPDIKLSARKGLVEERPNWPGADTPALLLSQRSRRLTARAADDILGAIAEEANLSIDNFTPHVLRHTFGTRLVREGHDLVLVAELMGYARLEQVRRYSLPTQADRQRAIDSLLTDA